MAEPEPDELLRVVGAEARATRERAGLTIGELSQRAGVGTTLIGLFENGRQWPAPGVKRNRLERGYGWEPGYIDSRQRGESTEAIVPAAPTVLDAMLADHEARIEALEKAVGLTRPGSDRLGRGVGGLDVLRGDGDREGRTGQEGRRALREGTP